MWKSLPFKSFLYISVALDLSTVFAIILLKNYLPPVVPLLYGNPSGENQLMPTLGLLLAPGIALVIMIVNTVISLTAKDEFLRKILMAAVLLISILTTITISKIFFLVGYF